MVAKHKNGTSSTGSIVRNNITMELKNGSAVVEEGNIILNSINYDGVKIHKQ